MSGPLSGMAAKWVLIASVLPFVLLTTSAQAQDDSQWGSGKNLYDTANAAGWPILALINEGAAESFFLHGAMAASGSRLQVQKAGCDLGSMLNFERQLPSGCGSMWFAPVSEARGSECRKQAALAKRILHKHGLDYVAEFIVAPRDMHHVIDVLYDRTKDEENQRADACFNELLDEFEKEGYAVYRVNTAFQERVAQSYGPVKRNVEHAIKRALDPNNILAPGRSGIDLDTYKMT